MCKKYLSCYLHQSWLTFSLSWLFPGPEFMFFFFHILAPPLRSVVLCRIYPLVTSAPIQKWFFHETLPLALPLPWLVSFWWPSRRTLGQKTCLCSPSLHISLSLSPKSNCAHCNCSCCCFSYSSCCCCVRSCQNVSCWGQLTQLAWPSCPSWPSCPFRQANPNQKSESWAKFLYFFLYFFFWLWRASTDKRQQKGIKAGKTKLMLAVFFFLGDYYS